MARFDRAIETDLTPFTERTITSQVVLKTEIEKVRKQGYAVAPEEVLPGINTVAVPVFDQHGTLAAALALVGSIQHISAQPDPRLLDLILDLGATASRLVGTAAH